MRSQKGFTLIELLTVIGIIGILAGLGIASFAVYKSSAAYGVASATLRDGRTFMEAGLNNYDDPPASVALYTQSSQGPLNDAAAAALMPGMMVPRNVKFQISYDADCASDSCMTALIQANHCQGEQFVRYVKFGDGSETLMENQAGSGCS